MKRNGFTLIEFALALIVVCTLLVVVVLVSGRLIGFGATYSEGERTGVVIKLSKKGYLFKTWEGELNLGGMSADSGGVVTPNIWRFSVTDEEIAQQGLAAASSASRVTVKYREVWKAAFWQGDTDHFAVSFQ